jgi:hypothetical protein
MAIPGEPTEPSVAFREVAIDEPSEPVVVTSCVDDTVPAIFNLDGTLVNPDHAGREWSRHEVATTSTRENVTRMRVPQPRQRAPRGKPVRRRGSRRTTAPARDGPEDSDPEPAGDGDPAGVATSQTLLPLRLGATP